MHTLTGVQHILDMATKFPQFRIVRLHENVHMSCVCIFNMVAAGSIIIIKPSIVSHAAATAAATEAATVHAGVAGPSQFKEWNQWFHTTVAAFM